MTNYFFKPVSNSSLNGEKGLFLTDRIFLPTEASFQTRQKRENPQVGQEVIEKIDSRVPAIKRFFTRIPDFSNFPASTGFLVMTIKRAQR